jgi:hypothetical protein
VSVREVHFHRINHRAPVRSISASVIERFDGKAIARRGFVHDPIRSFKK